MDYAGPLIDVFLGFFGALVAYTAARASWFHFRWKVLGRPPAFHDRDLVRETAEACARETVLARHRAAGTAPEAGERERQVADLAATYRHVIGAYVKNFSLQL